MTFVDTSALLAFFNQDDEMHRRAVKAFGARKALGQLRTHNYVVVETAAFLHRRVGAPAARLFLTQGVDALHVLFVDREIHEAAVGALVAARRARTSLVDFVSFEIMRREGIGTALAFDRDFRHQGFELIP